MDIDDLTLKQIKEISLLVGKNNSSMDHPYKIGQSYLIRSVTMYYTGRLDRVTEKELVFSDSAWIADTGRYNEALESGEFSEVEPIKGDLIIGRGSIIDAVEFNHDLPREVK